MAPFLRIAFNAYDVGELPPLSEPPFCAIRMKESVSTGTCSERNGSLALRRHTRAPPSDTVRLSLWGGTRFWRRDANVNICRGCKTPPPKKKQSCSQSNATGQCS